MPRKRTLEDLRSAQRNIAGRHDMGGTRILGGAGTSRDAERAPSLDGRSDQPLDGEGAIDTTRLDTSEWARDGVIVRPLIACDVALLAQTNQNTAILTPLALLS